MIHRYRFISLHHAVYGVARLCRVLAVKRRQGYTSGWPPNQPARNALKPKTERVNHFEAAGSGIR